MSNAKVEPLTTESLSHGDFLFVLLCASVAQWFKKALRMFTLSLARETFYKKQSDWWWFQLPAHDHQGIQYPQNAQRLHPKTKSQPITAER
jgi:hypothetical protein